MWWTIAPMILTFEFLAIGGRVTRSIVKEIMSLGVMSMGVVTVGVVSVGVVTMGLVTVWVVTMGVVTVGMLSMKVVSMWPMSMARMLITTVIMRGSMGPDGTRRRGMARGQLWKGSFLKGWSV